MEIRETEEILCACPISAFRIISETYTEVSTVDEQRENERSRLLKLLIAANCNIHLKLPTTGATPLLRAAGAGNLRGVCDLLQACPIIICWGAGGRVCPCPFFNLSLIFSEKKSM